MSVVLTGIKPSGAPHFGNYAGAIRPALELANDATRALYFIADYHALTEVRDPERLDRFVHEVAAAWLALGLDPARVVFYRQSAVPEIFELAWILACVSPKGLMNRAHAYKAALAENRRAGADPDRGVSMGLYAYPLLMAADILLFSADLVPVGEDQLQHVEIARDVARRFNASYGELLSSPSAHVASDAVTVLGLDGRKMSKRYGNTVPLFAEPAELRRAILSYVTDSSAPDAPKDPERSPVFTLYRAVATPAEIEALRERYAAGVSWGDVKLEVFRVVERFAAEPRRRFRELIRNRAELDAVLGAGAARARELARPALAKIRSAVGVR